MSETVDKAIRRAIKRFSLSAPLNVHNPQSISETAVSAVTENTQEIVQIGIEQDSVVVVDPQTSKVLAEKSKTEAYSQMIGAIKNDQKYKMKIFDDTLKSSQSQMKFSLFAATIGFFVVLGGVIAMMLGYTQVGIITSAAGIISEIVSVLFFNQSRHFTARLDKTLEKLLETEGYARAFAVAEQVPNETTRDLLIELIVKKMIGIQIKDQLSNDIDVREKEN